MRLYSSLLQFLIKVVFLATFPLVVVAGDISCATGSYMQAVASGVDLTSFMQGVVYSGIADFKADFIAHFPLGNFCGSYAGNTYVWVAGPESDFHIQRRCQYNGGNAGFPVPGADLFEQCVGSAPPGYNGSCGSGGGATSVGFTSTSPMTFVAPAFACVGGCQLSSDPTRSGSVGVSVGDSSAFSFSSPYSTVGRGCMNATPNASPAVSGTAISGTHSVQINPSSKCGTVDGGQFVCSGALPNNSCVKTANGWGVCAVGGAARTTPTPPGPDTGAAGTAASPVAVIQVGNGTSVTSTLVYSSGTMTTSTVGAANGSVSNSSGTGTPGSSGTQPKDPPQCGAPGMPACSVTQCGGQGQPVCNAVSGGADCTAPPSCAGDPVLCYQANQEWKTACALVGSSQGEIDSAITAGINAETGGNGLLNSTNGTTIDMAANFQSGIPSGGQLSDITINLVGYAHPVTIPMSNWTTLLQTIGLLVLISAHLTGARIVMTG